MTKRKWIIYGSIIALIFLSLVGFNLNLSYSSKKDAERAKEAKIQRKLDKLASLERYKIAQDKADQRFAIRKRIHESEIRLNEEYSKLSKNLESSKSIRASIKKLRELSRVIRPEHQAALYESKLIIQKRRLHIENLEADKAEDEKLLDELDY